MIVFQAMYNKRTTFFDTVKLAMLNPNDPRTFPRFIVSSTVVTFFTLMTVNFLLYRKDHFKVEHKNDPFAAHLTERPTRVTKVLSQGPIVVNAKRYGTLKKEGLGVDHDEWLKRKYME